ncbi:WYL domain-containing protein [Azospirillum himalayense]|uniref:WYL domain-containing protein n=1 Tax=Azospirillum himalayense TaxID=654847 RepID=A0ABW0GHD7_9PROT
MKRRIAAGIAASGPEMPRKHNDALPGDKLLALYQRLTLDGRKHFQTDLARDLVCSAQSIVRLIAIIERNLGQDAYIESGLESRRRFYRLRSRTEEKSLGFTFEELHCLAACRDIAAQFLPESVVDRISSTVTALALHLAEGSQPIAGQPIGFRGKGFIDYSPHFRTITILRKAIERRQVCRIVYRARGRQAEGVYRYAPGRLVAMSGTLYAQGYRMSEGSVLPERPTTFSIHRIAEVTPTGEYFRFNAADGEARTFGLGWHEPRRVAVRVESEAADYVRDRIWSDDQVVVDQVDGSIILSVTTTSEKELNAWVSSFGGQARILTSVPRNANN